MTNGDCASDKDKPLSLPSNFYGLADGDLFASKPVSIHWELKFTRSIYQTVDMAEQGVLLNEVARFVDAGTLHSTATERHAPQCRQPEAGSRVILEIILRYFWGAILRPLVTPYRRSNANARV